MYFVSGTRPDTKCIGLYFLLTQKTLRGFFDSLNGTRKGAVFAVPGTEMGNMGIFR